MIIDDDENYNYHALMHDNFKVFGLQNIYLHSEKFEHFLGYFLFVKNKNKNTFLLTFFSLYFFNH